MSPDRASTDRRAVAGLFEALSSPLAHSGGGARDGWLRVLVATFGRMLEVEGAERLTSAEPPVIFALNHGNATEALLAPAALIWLAGGRPVHFLADWMYLELPGIGRLLRLSEPIPVFGKPARWRWRERTRRAGLTEPALDRTLALLARGESVGLFPEGTRNGDPDRLRPGRRGLGELALRSSAPIVPVGLHYPAAARLGRIPRLGRTVLRVGEALHFDAEREQLRRAGFDRAARRGLAEAVVAKTLAALAELAGKRSAAAEPRRVLPPVPEVHVQPPPFASTLQPERDSA